MFSKKYIKHLISAIFGRIPGSYGQDDILRKYINYPKFLPLNVQIQHGWYSSEIPDSIRLDDIKIMLVWSQRIADEWRKITKKSVYVIGAPFILYKEMHSIKKDPDAIGTVVFPNHSTPSNIEKYDVDVYSRYLKQLPDTYKPITVCLHYRDFDLYSLQFKKNGFNVVTAGDSRQKNNGFVKNFYNILKKHKYCCSNEIGSYTFYAVDLGIPFFIYGPESITQNKKNNKIIEKTKYRIDTRNLFKTMNNEISIEQKNYVDSELGTYDRISISKLRKIIFLRLFFIEIPSYPIRFLRALFSLLKGAII
jgi:hypothetical protein